MASWDDGDKALNEAIRKLREEDRIVVQILPEDRIESLEESFARLDEELIKEDGEFGRSFADTQNRRCIRYG